MTGTAEAEENELTALRKEVRRMRMENDLLKQAAQQSVHRVPQAHRRDARMLS